jgi:hypothetical protein
VNADNCIPKVFLLTVKAFSKSMPRNYQIINGKIVIENIDKVQDPEKQATMVAEANSKINGIL